MSNAFQAETAIVHPNVTLGECVELQDYAIVGVPPIGARIGELDTVLGRGSLIRSHTVIYAGNEIGAHFQTGHGVMIRELNQIMDDVSVGTQTVIEHHVKIGMSVRIHSRVFIPEYSVLDEGSWVGPGTVFTNATYPLGKETKSRLKGPHLLPRAKVGANVTVLPGVVIGENSLVGAGSVVVNDVPDGKVVAGNPARIINSVANLAAYM